VFLLTSRDGFVIAVVGSNLELETAEAVATCGSLCDRGERTVNVEVEEGEKVEDKRYGACS
jgi:hypothetical protein